MKGVTLLLAFVVTLAAVLAAPSGTDTKPSLRRAPRPVLKGQHLAHLSDQEILQILLGIIPAIPRPLGDSFSEYLEATLGITVKDFLTSILSIFLGVADGIARALSQLGELTNNPDVDDEVTVIMTALTANVSDKTSTFTNFLTDVLPIITSSQSQIQQSAAEIILAFLGLTLEEYFIGVGSTVGVSLTVLDKITDDLDLLADKSPAPITEILERVARGPLNDCMLLLVPLRDRLHLLLGDSDDDGLKIRLPLHPARQLLENLIAILRGIYGNASARQHLTHLSSDEKTQQNLIEAYSLMGDSYYEE